MDNRGNKAIMIGYACGSRDYKLWDSSRHRIVIFRDVRFQQPDEPSNDLSDQSKTVLNEEKECDMLLCESSKMKDNNKPDET